MSYFCQVISTWAWELKLMLHYATHMQRQRARMLQSNLSSLAHVVTFHAAHTKLA